MFASFWNRNHAVRTLQRSAKNYHAMVEAEKKVHLVHLSAWSFFIASSSILVLLQLVMDDYIDDGHAYPMYRSNNSQNCVQAVAL